MGQDNVAPLWEFLHIFNALQDASQAGDLRGVKRACERMVGLEPRVRSDAMLLKGELKTARQSCDAQEKAASRMETRLFEVMENYEHSIAVFQRFRIVIGDMQQKRSLADFSQFLPTLKQRLEVDGVRLLLHRELCGEFVKDGVDTVAGRALEQAVAGLCGGLESNVPESGGPAYLGPVRELPQADFFLGNPAPNGGSCYVHPLENKYEPGCHIGVLTLYSADGQRYEKTKATDFLSHFCEQMACALVTVRDHDVLLHQSVIDSLTGVHNRLYLERHAPRMLDFSRRKGFPVSLLFVDLDRFKPINDTLGHDAGDLILREVARRLVDEVRNYDIFVRLGGDEFVLLCPDTDAHEAEAMAVRLRRAVESLDVECCTGCPVRQFAADGLRMSASVGVATRVAPESLEALLHEADQAMYECKRRARKVAEVKEKKAGGAT